MSIFFQPQRDAPPDPASYVLSTGLDKGRDFELLVLATAGLGRPLKIKAGRHPVPVDPVRFPHVEVIERFLSYLDFRDLYEKAAVVAIPTKDTPNACGVTSLMEAMAMCKAVVVSDNPALADYLPPPEAEAAVVVPIGDVGALHAAIADLLANPEKAAAMGRRARAFAVKRFHPQPNLKVLTDLCWEIVGEARTDLRPL
jgi:glycosyltransferase involved in cell wall biosynthesis